MTPEQTSYPNFLIIRIVSNRLTESHIIDFFYIIWTMSSLIKLINIKYIVSEPTQSGLQIFMEIKISMIFCNLFNSRIPE